MLGDSRLNSWVVTRVMVIISISAVVASLGFASTRGDDASKETGQAARLGPMREIVDWLTLEAPSPRLPGKVERMADPIYIYTDPARDFPYGAVWAWGRAGRPIALLSIAAEQKSAMEPLWLCELTSTAPGLVSVGVPGGLRWNASKAGLVLRSLPKQQVPAADAAGRLRQMKELARRIKAFEIYMSRRATVPERFDLRLLPQPVHRYSDPSAGLIDGGLFLFAYGGNPEIVLAIEARRSAGSDPAWSYGFARMAAAELHASLDGVEVWTQPKFTMQSDPETYRLFTIPRLVERAADGR